jgi:hypothetical protein
MRRTLVSWLAAASLLVALAPATANAAQPAVAAVDVDALYKEGTQALQAGNFDVAYDRLLHAWNERQSFDIAANLALAERELGRRRDAAEHLRWAIKNAPPSTSEEKRARLGEDLKALEADLGRITLTVPDETHIFVDDKEVGVAPVETFYVDPGAHTLGAAHRTEGGTTVNLQLARGQEMNLVLKLEAGKGPKLPDSGPIQPPPHEDKPVWPTVVLGSVAGVGFGLGIAGIVISLGAASDADDAAAGLVSGGKTCTSDPAACADIQSNLDDEVTFRGLGIGGFVVGGLALAGMITYLVVPMGGDEAAPDKSAFYFTPMLGETNGFVLGGRF